MGFKMKGFNAGKGTGTSKGFSYVGTHTTNPDGSVTWTPSQEWKNEQNRKNTIDETNNLMYKKETLLLLE